MAGQASIHSLPTEIKTRIAELCHLQDKMIQDVFRGLHETAKDHCLRGYNASGSETEWDSDYDTDEETDEFRIGPFTDRRFYSGRYPKSLLSLSRVSREWRNIAVSIVFRKLTASQCSKPIFLFALAPRFGHLVEELNLTTYWPTSFSIINTLTSLAHLPNVWKVALPSLGFVRGRLASQADRTDFPVEFTSPEFVAAALQRIIQRVEVIVLPFIKDLSDTILILRGQRLTRLEVTPTSEDLPTLLSTILDCPNLCTLKITTSHKRIFSDATTLPYLSHPTLRRLEISDRYGGKGFYDFVYRFRTLEELEVSWANDTREIPELPDPCSFQLPRLRQLEVRGTLRVTTPLVQNVSPSIFPALKTCTWVLNNSFWFVGRKDYAAAADAIGSVRDQHVDRAEPLELAIDLALGGDPAMYHPALKNLGIEVGLAQSGIVVSFERPRSAIEPRPSDPPSLILKPKLCRTDYSAVDHLGDDISDSLDRIRDLKDQAVAVEDRFQISRIAQALQEAEWLYLPRKASIHSLPTEIKRRIAELCQLQDETSRDVFAHLRYRLADNAYASDEAETDLSKRGPFAEHRYGPKSLLSLSCVSKEWRDIALKILLRKVTGRQCSEPIFLFAIAPQYGHLVEELDIEFCFEGCSNPINILLGLAYLPSVRKITLPSMAFVSEQLAEQARVSNSPVEAASPAFVASALRRLTQHAEHVTMPLDDLGATLSKSSVFENAASLPYPPHPTLHRLEIVDQSGGGGLHDFVCRFFPNLEELEIYIRSNTLETTGPPDLRHFALPRIQQLRVSGSLTCSTPLVRHISPSIFPALQTCTWVLPYIIPPLSRAAFAAEVVDTIGHLRDHQANRAVPLHFKIDFAREEDRANLQPMLEAHGITKNIEPGGGGVVISFEPALRIDNGFSDPPDQILIPELCRTDEDQVEDLGNIITTSLDRIRDLKDAAVAVKDRFQISRIAQALQEAEWLCVERKC
ncbi:hypothetical protein B0A53_03491 [Rhodotorula sp. CCFEE 5036]|nr:hypothetical protein B0A53_03491 [Rhodotorula sp. CCFEE 5036]